MKSMKMLHQSQEWWISCMTDKWLWHLLSVTMLKLGRGQGMQQAQVTSRVWFQVQQLRLIIVRLEISIGLKMYFIMMCGYFSPTLKMLNGNLLFQPDNLQYESLKSHFPLNMHWLLAYKWFIFWTLLTSWFVSNFSPNGGEKGPCIGIGCSKPFEQQ